MIAMRARDARPARSGRCTSAVSGILVTSVRRMASNNAINSRGNRLAGDVAERDDHGAVGLRQES